MAVIPGAPPRGQLSTTRELAREPTRTSLAAEQTRPGHGGRLPLRVCEQLKGWRAIEVEHTCPSPTSCISETRFG